MSEYYLSAVVHGESKVGKTELGVTSPGRVLYLDAEAGGFRFVEAPRIVWDPLRDPVPEAGDWKICRVPVTSDLTLATAIDFLERGNHPFESVVWDSVTEAQTYLKRDKSAVYKLDQQDWGDLLAKIEGYIMRLRDCVQTQEQMKALVIIAHSAPRPADDRMAPLIQGAMKNKLAFKLDMTGFLFSVVDEAGETRRGLRITENRDAVAGARWPRGLDKPDVIWDPDISEIQQRLEAHMKEHS